MTLLPALLFVFGAVVAFPSLAEDTGPTTDNPEWYKTPQRTVKRRTIKFDAAPHPRKPGAAPIIGAPRISLSEGIMVVPNQPTLINFLIPTQEFLDSLEFEEMEIPLSKDEPLRAIKVRGVVEDTTFSAERFHHNQKTGRWEATGDVRFEQEESLLQADRLQYVIPEREAGQVEKPTPLLMSQEEALTRKRLVIGQLDAENVYTSQKVEEFAAKNIFYDFATETGHLEQVQGRRGSLFFGAATLDITGPRQARGTDVWVTTCTQETPHFSLYMDEAEMQDGEFLMGRKARLVVAGRSTPIYWPKWRFGVGDTPRVSYEFESGHRAEIGYYVNVAQWFPITPDANMGMRLMPTTNRGVGIGVDLEYDYMNTPASPLFRSTGQLRSIASTKDGELIEYYHRQELTPDLTLLTQVEHWDDKDFYKDWFFNEYKDRSDARSFIHLVQSDGNYVATVTARKTLNNFTSETERLPEATFHLLERPLIGPLYFTYDAALGYLEREPSDLHSARFSNVGRLTYDLDFDGAFNITPFLELEGTWYSDRIDRDGDGFRFSNTTGVTVQSRFHKAYPGRWGFSGFKHLIMPSMTYSYRPEPTTGIDELPRFDALDNVFGRSRIETKIDNILLGRDEVLEETWQVARVSLYQGNDFWNELRKSEDYEMEIDIRPRPWWGILLAAEKNRNEQDLSADTPFFFQRAFLETYERIVGEPFDEELGFRFNSRYGDYERFLLNMYTDTTQVGGNYTARLGFAYANTSGEVYNKEIIYGAGYKVSRDWAFSFEHRYDFDQDDLVRQNYEVRRRFDCWELALGVSDRPSGWDFSLEFNLTAFPSSKMKF